MQPEHLRIHSVGLPFLPLRRRRPAQEVTKMHVQIVNFNLEGMSYAGFLQACDEQFAPAFANVPGLLYKLWLSESRLEHLWRCLRLARSAGHAGLHGVRPVQSRRVQPELCEHHVAGLRHPGGPIARHSRPNRGPRLAAASRRACLRVRVAPNRVPRVSSDVVKR